MKQFYIEQVLRGAIGAQCGDGRTGVRTESVESVEVALALKKVSEEWATEAGGRSTNKQDAIMYSYCAWINTCISSSPAFFFHIYVNTCINTHIFLCILKYKN